jgi:nicotinamidase-related amidase
MRILPEQTMGIAIDYQERLIPAIEDNTNLIKNSKILLAGLALLGVPLLVTRQYPKGIGDTVEEIRAVTAGARIFDKTAFSCYQDAAIKTAVDELRRQGRKNIVLCGTEAHVCALQTALDLLAAGYSVVYVADCIGSRKFGDKKTALKRAVSEGALLTTYEALLFELTASSGHPAFKGISQLVK